MRRAWLDRLPRVPVAWLALTHDWRRSAAAVAGVAFAVLFMFMQLGFLGSTQETATAVTSKIDGELVLVSSRYVSVSTTGSIPRARLAVASSDPDVQRVSLLYTGYAGYLSEHAQSLCDVLVLGIRPGMGGLKLPELPAFEPKLTAYHAALVDTQRQPKVGSVEVGLRPHVGGRQLEIIGNYELGAGYLADTIVIVSDQTFLDLFEVSPADTHIGVIKLREGADVDEAHERIAAMLPQDTHVLDVDEIASRQIRRWVSDLAIGKIFSIGAVVGFIVGLVILFQVLSTEITNQLPYYATLKAIGFEDRRLYEYVLHQGLLFAVRGVVLATPVTIWLYGLVAEATAVALGMTAGRFFGVTALTFAMCTASGVLAVQKIRDADPADLF